MAENETLIKHVLSIIPPLSFSSHKGQAGRIGVIGGCKEYTGAPFFAAISALKVGCDLAHVFCTQEAAPVIKSYSPELIVYPILDTSTAAEDFRDVLPKLHSIVVGPGLGRDSRILETASVFIGLAMQRKLPIVLDADGVFCVTENPELIRGYRKAILTPNVMEFKRLYSAVARLPLLDAVEEEHVKHLSFLLGNVTIVRKGPRDVISDGETTVTCEEPGSPRRCGGQGDLLSGSMGVFSYWAHEYYSSIARSDGMTYSATVVAALAACMLTRKCNWLAFQEYRRSTTTSDMIVKIRKAFSLLFSTD